jgi:hypothetical protein
LARLARSSACCRTAMCSERTAREMLALPPSAPSGHARRSSPRASVAAGTESFEGGRHPREGRQAREARALGARRRGGLTDARDRSLVLPEKEGRGAILVASLDVEVTGPGVRAAHDVVLAPLGAAETDIDGERQERAPGPVGRWRRLKNPDATLARGRASAREAMALDTGERFHERVFDPVLRPLGRRRLIARGERGDERESERAQGEPADGVHERSFQGVG